MSLAKKKYAWVLVGTLSQHAEIRSLSNESY